MSIRILNVVILIAVIAAACGGSPSKLHKAGVFPSFSQHDTSIDTLPVDIRLSLDALTPPAGCDAKLFNALKRSFARALAETLSGGGKLASTPPMGDNNKATGLTVTQVGADSILNWNYRNTGDYDQNGTVGITDITPIAMHYGHAVGTDPLDVVIDGDGGGTVGISDVTPLAMNFGVNMTSYAVEESGIEAGPYLGMGNVLLSSGTGEDQGWMQLQYALSDANPCWLRVVPLDASGNPGVASDALQFMGNNPPEIVAVSPLTGAIGASVQFSAVVNGVGPFTYAWSFNGAATPDSSTDEQPNVILSSTPGEYNCTVEVTNAAGPTLFPFTVTIGAPPSATAVSPLTGFTGEDVQFTVSASGTPPFTYAWDFGGGATPDTSALESPTVNLNAPGVYDNASVTVTNPFGESFYGFTLTVNDVIPDITAAGPEEGIRGTQTVFTATVTGVLPMTYTWDFGDATMPGTSTEISPLVTLVGLGTFPCTLSVNNAYGSDVYSFDLAIMHDPAYDEIEPNNSIPEANALPASPVIDWHCRLTQTDDENDFFSFPGEFGDKVDSSAQLETDDPDINLELQNSSGNVLAASSNTIDSECISYILSAADTYYIRCYYAGHAAVNAGDYWLDVSVNAIQFDEVEDNDALIQANPIAFPLESFYGHAGPGGYDGDNDDYFTFDAAVNDQIRVSLQQTDANYDIDIELLDGSGSVLAYSYNITAFEEFEYYFLPTDTGPYYLYIAACTNGGFYELNGTLKQARLWSEYVIDDTTSADLGLYSALVDAGGHPGCFYYDASNGRILYAYSELEDGTGSWTSYYCDTWLDVGSHLSAATVNGLPAAAYLDDGAGGVRFAICDSVDGSGIWNYGMIDNLADRGPSVACIGGYPAISYGDSSGNVHFAINGEAGGGGSWYSYPVTATGPGAWATSLVELSSGMPAIVYDASASSRMDFAVCDAADGSGTWTIYQTAFINGASPASAGLTVGNPSFATVGENGRASFVGNQNNDGSGVWASNGPFNLDVSGNVSLAVMWGWPRILFGDTADSLYYSTSVDENGCGDWMIGPVRWGARVGSSRSLGYVNGSLCCVFYDTANHYVGFAYPTS